MLANQSLLDKLLGGLWPCLSETYLPPVKLRSTAPGPVQAMKPATLTKANISRTRQSLFSGASFILQSDFQPPPLPVSGESLSSQTFQLRRVRTAHH